MSMPIFDTPEKVEKLRQMRGHGAQIWELCAEFRCSPNIVNKWIAKLGLPPYRHVIDRKLVGDMWLANRRPEEIAKQARCNPAHVIRIATKELGLGKRTPTDMLKADIAALQAELAQSTEALADRDAQLAKAKAELTDALGRLAHSAGVSEMTKRKTPPAPPPTPRNQLADIANKAVAGGFQVKKIPQGKSGILDEKGDYINPKTAWNRSVYQAPRVEAPSMIGEPLSDDEQRALRRKLG
jgi:hypothetical protein